MDETLLNSDKEVSKKNYDAIKYFTSEGGKFAVASGRTVAAVRNYVQRIGINAPAVTYNGAMIYSFDKEKTVYRMDIEEERKAAVRKVWETQPRLGIEVYADEHIYIMRECFETARLYDKNYDVTYSMPDKIWDVPWTKVLIIGTEEQLDEFEQIYSRDYDDGYIVRSGKFYLDIVANGASKGYGVKKLAQLLGIKQENVYAVGDNMNDIEMIEYANHGYAVANATAELIGTAEAKVPSNNDDAIAYIIENLIF